MAANMDTVGTFQMAEAFASQKLFTCIHKHYPVETWEEWTASHKDIIDYVAVSSGNSLTHSFIFNLIIYLISLKRYI